MIFKESSERMDDSKEFFLFWSFGILKKVVMKKSFTFSFCERDFLYTQTLKEEEEEKDVGIVRSHPRLVHGRTKAPPVLVSMRVRWQKARLLFLFLRRRLRLLPFWCVVVFKSAFGCLEFFYPNKNKDDDDEDVSLLLSFGFVERARATKSDRPTSFIIARVRQNRLTKAVPKAAARKTPVALAVNAELVRFFGRLVLFFCVFCPLGGVRRRVQSYTTRE